MRLGSPRFMLHDLRKMLATVGEKLGLSSAVLRRILNHATPKTDVLHRHYVGLAVGNVLEPLVKIQDALVGLMEGRSSQWVTSEFMGAARFHRAASRGRKVRPHSDLPLDWTQRSWEPGHPSQEVHSGQSPVSMIRRCQLPL